MFPTLSRAGLRLALLLLCLGPARTAMADGPRTVSFHLGAQCLCAQCAFDAQRALKKLPGVQNVKLDARQRRLDITLDEAKRPVSTLAAFLAKLDIGSESALIWPDGNEPDTVRAAEELAQVPGVQSAKADAKAHTVLLTFAAGSAVTTTQLAAALGHPPAKGAPAHA